MVKWFSYGLLLIMDMVSLLTIPIPDSSVEIEIGWWLVVGLISALFVYLQARIFHKSKFKELEPGPVFIFILLGFVSLVMVNFFAIFGGLPDGKTINDREEI